MQKDKETYLKISIHNLFVSINKAYNQQIDFIWYKN